VADVRGEGYALKNRANVLADLNRLEEALANHDEELLILQRRF
jgi:hypothetical protein